MGKGQRRSLTERITELASRGGKGISADRLASLLRIKKGERASFVITLARMERDGQLVRDKKGKYKAMASIIGISAQIVSLQRGYAFARTDKGDVFIAGRDLGGALPGDTVLITTKTGDSRGLSGSVLKIENRGERVFSGRLIHSGKWQVRPDAFIKFDIDVKKAKRASLNPDDKVRFKVEYNRSGELIAEILTVYGSANSAHVCADAIVDAAGIPVIFSHEAIMLARNLSIKGMSDEELKGRDDLRDWIVFTIDGKDAKDLDDAVSLDRTDNGWRLGVHIADVSHYVRENTPLDKDARLRGNSVYFADRVIPMLPKELSNGICSLNEGEDKLALSAILKLDNNGVLLSASIKKTVIKSCLRGVYSEVNAIFDGSAGAEIKAKYEPVYRILENMRILAQKMSDVAAKRGLMEFISVEPMFTLDENGHPIDIQKRTMGVSEGIIEQFMIAANVAVAEYSRKHGLPFVYRIHEHPDPDKLLVLEQISSRLGFKTRLSGSPHDLRALIDEARETPYERLISDRLLRSMAKARYSDKPVGHYGLSLKDYCHFTAPIRRYSDLSVHRILSAFLSGVPKQEVKRRFAEFAYRAAELSSQYELRALNAERECEGCYMAEYMLQFIGQQLQGIISTVTPFGFYVELDNSVEGLVRIESLNRHDLQYDEVASLTDSIGRPLYTVGDRITVMVVSADVSTGRIDFEPAN
ncbi:MAG: ribonuclease R [Oscillospiraceae bacterium]|nr:ribonuclease R [Oscillospiraceae bacterium]